jgi:hypothetical protein
LKEAFSYLGSKAWANDHLRYAISVLKGSSGMVASRDGILQTVLMLKEDLEDFGFWWQARIVEYWIHRWQDGDFTAPRGADSPKGEGEKLHV